MLPVAGFARSTTGKVKGFCIYPMNAMDRPVWFP
jgi:hypothetical protein